MIGEEQQKEGRIQSLEYETVFTHFYRVKYPYFRTSPAHMGRPYPLFSWWINTSHLVVDMPIYWSFWQRIQKVRTISNFRQCFYLAILLLKNWSCSNFLNSLSKTSTLWHINHQVWCVHPSREEWVGPTHLVRARTEIWVLYSVKMGENSFIFQWLYVCASNTSLQISCKMQCLYTYIIHF